MIKITGSMRFECSVSEVGGGEQWSGWVLGIGIDGVVLGQICVR